LAIMTDIKNLDTNALDELGHKLRDRILEVVSHNGGHLTSSLGAVEIIMAMHYVFDVSKDPFIFDVSHQAYAHKLLTGRWDEFDTLRQFGGICGFTKPSESDFDYFAAGHSSTSISAAVGAAKAIALNGEDRVPVVLIGDGSMTAGMVYEALNELGHHKYPMVIVLNDNEMSIAKPIGAISEYLSKALSSKTYQGFKKRVEGVLHNLPSSIDYLMRRFERGFKLITPGIIFEELGLDYIGPADGHNIEDLIDIFTIAKSMKKPVIIHVQTTKGKGYAPAEGKHEHWHGVGPFDKDKGELSKSKAKSATAIFSEKLLELAKKDKKVVGVTAAMPSGTGMDKLLEAYPDRFWDVAICEQHAVTSMAAMAKEGFKPFVAIYSTFLQRAYDQIVHDVALQNLPVVFAIDRAGIVGEDGETHQGVFDIAYLRSIPNMEIFAPRDEKSFSDAMEYAHKLDKPCALRYPRGSFLLDAEFETSGFENKKAQLLEDAPSDTLFIGYGNGVGRAYKTSELLKKEDIYVGLLDLRFVKPLDCSTLKYMAKKYKKWFVFSDSSKMGGIGEILSLFLQEEAITDVRIESFEYEDIFIQHGKTVDVENYIGLTPNLLADKIKLKIIKKKDGKL
jgi:1-deoxy-D-xylulose-5-phosphate synthase